MVLRGMRDEGLGIQRNSSLIPQPSSLSQDRRPGAFHGAENLLIEVVRQFALERRGGGSIDDLRDLGGVMRRERQTRTATKAARSGGGLAACCHCASARRLMSHAGF